MHYFLLAYICVYCFNKTFLMQSTLRNVYLLSHFIHLDSFGFSLSVYHTINILFQKIHNDDQFSILQNDYLSVYHWIGISSQNVVTLVGFFLGFFFKYFIFFISCFLTMSYNSLGRINEYLKTLVDCIFASIFN